MKESLIRKQELFDEMLRLGKEDAEHFFHDTSQRTNVPCPACGETRFEPAFTKSSFTYVVCENCKTLFVNPRPSFDQFRDFYTHGKSAKYYAEKFFPPVAEQRRSLIFAPRAQSVAPLVQSGTVRVVGDIGAGFGIFCEELKKLFSEISILAIEPEQTMAALCREKGFSVIEQSLEDVNAQDQSFDLLTAFELMEHIHTPITFLQKVHELLNPGGYFLFTTLTLDGFDIQLLWEKSKSISPPHHINFLTVRGAELLLQRAGFDVKEITTPGKLDVDIIAGMMKDGFDPGRFFTLLYERGEETQEAFQQFLSQHRLSSHLRVLAQKRP